MQESTSKVILVFGGAGGIGAEVSAQLTAAGATVVIADLNAAQAQAKAGVACDITDPDSCESAAQAAVDRFGRLDGMVNCAGISRPHDSISLPPAEFVNSIVATGRRPVFARNLTAAPLPRIRACPH